MADYSEQEKRLLSNIPENSPLRTSLAHLREAVENIWLPGGPRVIHDYTDHGIPHCERIAGYALELLRNSGETLLPDEMYLLLAGIYLHDIGMQCDVARHEAIEKLAQQLGADFGIIFTAHTASSYPINEQKAIRKNHHYLSIAWIDHANRTGETILAPARDIPVGLVDDLMEICKHHTSLSIYDCGEKLLQVPKGRKRFIAALLRICDELDIAANRVEIRTVENFKLDPSNEVFWWLHNRTRIDISPTNVIRLTVWLHPDDGVRYRETIQTAYIDRFNKKNQPVLDVLVQSGLRIFISPQATVEQKDRYERFPVHIREALQALSGPPKTSAKPEEREAVDTKVPDTGSPDSVQASLCKLMKSFGEIQKLFAKHDIRPGDCDKVLDYLAAAESSYKELGDALIQVTHNPGYTLAIREYRPLRHKLEEWIQELRSSVSQFRVHCPPATPANERWRERLHALSLQPGNRLNEFKILLPTQ
jgi:hypothetical protein